MSKKQRLKQMHDQKKTAEKDLKEVETQLESLLSRKSELKKTIAHCDAVITILKEERPRVSQHAVYRYLQRVVGMDIPQIHDQMLTPYALDLMDKMGWADGKYPTGDGATLVIKEGVVVTVHE